MEGLQGSGIGWLLAGFFFGWLGNWLFDRLYRRDGAAATGLGDLQREALQADLRKLDAGLAERDARIDALQAELRTLADRVGMPPGGHAPPRHPRGGRGRGGQGEGPGRA